MAQFGRASIFAGARAVAEADGFAASLQHPPHGPVTEGDICASRTAISPRARSCTNTPLNGFRMNRSASQRLCVDYMSRPPTETSLLRPYRLGLRVFVPSWSSCRRVFAPSCLRVIVPSCRRGRRVAVSSCCRVIVSSCRRVFVPWCRRVVVLQNRCPGEHDVFPALDEATAAGADRDPRR